MDRDLSSYNSLLERYEVTKKELGQAEDTLRRITGRDPDLFASSGANRWKNQTAQFPGKVFQNRKRPLFPIGRSKEEEAIDEESPDEDGLPTKKPSLPSTVVATPKDVKSRKDSIREQNIDSKVTARNRRMLGMIMGTLQKFQTEEDKRKQQEKKKAEIEMKVEAAAQEEKERIKREKEELFTTRREKQIQLRCLEKKLEIAEMHEVWEMNHNNMWNFIQTKAHPPLFFLPKSHNDKSKKCLDESKLIILEKVQAHREAVEKELLEVEEWYKKDSFPGDKENVGPSEEEEPAEEKTLPILPDQEFEPIYDE